jgi:ring-1,2-phenylacetyl-CoA epoxidase subunit PaaC
MCEGRLELLLALADDALVLGQRCLEWTGVAPHLEEDLAFTSIGLDELGHAAVWFRLAAQDGGGAVDELALGRGPEAYRCCRLVERPNGDWAFTIARHWLAAHAEDERLAWVGGSRWDELATATGPLRREVRWHLEHAEEWMDRLAAQPPGRARLEDGLRCALAEAESLFAPSLGEDEAVADGTLPEPSAAARERWRRRVHSGLERLGLERLDGPIGGGELPRDVRGEDFLPLWQELTGLHRAHSGAAW